MTWGFLPPAVSDVFLSSVIAGLLRGDKTALDDEICKFLGCRAATTGSSWVLVLRTLLEQIAKRRPVGSEVILPSYSCNEFTKAVLLAGLRPRYVDLRRDFASDPTAIASAIGPATLAVFAINNLGRASDNAAIRELCDRHDVICIEDATYTFLGATPTGQRFGSFGHYAVLNFSEGKIIPVGGGAVVTNVEAGIEVIESAHVRIATRKPTATLRELLSLVIYRAGSSRLGYTAYRLLREATGADLKQRLSMEPSRAQEVGSDLERDERGEVVLRSDRVATLADATELRPLGRPKQLCGVAVIRNADTLRARRQARLALFRAALPKTAELLALPDDGMPIKAPIVAVADVSPDDERALNRFGVWRGYATAYPTYGDRAYPQSNRFFERVFTLPLHRYVGPTVVSDIVDVLARMRSREAEESVQRSSAQLVR